MRQITNMHTCKLILWYSQLAKKYLCVLIFIIASFHMSLSQETLIDKASNELCKCLTVIDTNQNDNNKLKEAYQNCMTNIITDNNQIIKNQSDVIKLIDLCFLNCNQIMRSFNNKLEQTTEIEKYLNKNMIQNVDCKKYLSSRYIQIDPAVEELSFIENYVLETIPESDYYLKSKIKWTSPCSFYLTLDSTNMNFVLQNYNYSDTIFAEIIQLENDSLITKATLNSVVRIYKYIKKD